MSFSALKLFPLTSALPAILIKDMLFLLLAFVFLTEVGLRSHAPFDLMKIHKDELEIWFPCLGGAEGPSLGAEGNLSQHLSWELHISVGINDFVSLLTNIPLHLGLIFGVQASLSLLLLSLKNNNKYA